MTALLVSSPWLLGVLALGISVMVTGLRLRFAGRGLDFPDHRSLHSRPVPHGGGLGIVAAALVCGAIAGVDASWLVLPLLLALVSWADDWLDLPFWVRLPAHLGCAGVLVIAYGIASWPVALMHILVIAWSTNAYNFMDGADGLAGSMAVSGFSAYAAGFLLAGQAAMAGLCLAVAGAAAGFLYFNWHPARIFMGDVGSIPLGFLAGGVGWHGNVTGVWPVWFGPLVFAPFLFDASATLMRRAVRGEQVWRAHRDHYYQRMVRAGMAHDAMCRRWLLTMFSGGALALLLLKFAGSGAWVGAVAWGVFLLLLGRRIDARWLQHCRREMPQ